MLPKRRAESDWPISPMDFKCGEFRSWFIHMGWFPLTYTLSATNLLITSGVLDSKDVILSGHYWNMRPMRIYKKNYKVLLLKELSLRVANKISLRN